MHIVSTVQDGLLGGSHGWGGQTPLSKICHISYNDETWHSYTLRKKRSKKCVNHVTHLLSSTDISNFSPEISKFCYIKKYMYRLHFYRKFQIILTFLQSLKTVIIKIVAILMMQEKRLHQAFLK